MSLAKTLNYHFLWVLYFLFVAVVLLTHDGDNTFSFGGEYGFAKAVVWLVYIGFLAYSIWVSTQESFFKSLARMNPILWSRQIGIDLYIGVAFFAYLLYLNEGSLLVLALWALPMLIFANLATLLYLALNFESIVQHFLV